MQTLILVAEGGVILLLAKLLWNARRRQRDLQNALTKRTPYLLDEAPGFWDSEWSKTAQVANKIIEDLRATEAERTGQHHQIEATLGSLQEGVLAVDETNTLVLANQALATIFPQRAVTVGQRVEVVAHSSAFLAFLDDVRRGAASARAELEFTSATGSVWVEATGAVVAPWNGTKGRWVLCVLHEITRQKMLENMRKEFVANVSHELRTPLSVIKGFIETLVDGHATIPEADRDRFLRTVQRHAERLHFILEDLLALSRLESRTPGIRLEETDLHNMIRELADDYRQRATSTAHHVNLELTAPGGSVAADPVRLRQVFDNLLDNALKYTPANSFITIRTAARENSIEVRIVDNGPGIPAKDLPHIFERFYRVDKGRSREKGGTGLGLSIVKHIVQLHNGQVWAESQLGQGTTIVIMLPLQAGKPAAV